LAKRFDYFDTTWDAESTGSSSGAGFFGDALPPLSSHGVRFRSPWGEFSGTLATPDPNDASDDELSRALGASLERRVIDVVESENIVWRPGGCPARCWNWTAARLRFYATFAT